MFLISCNTPLSVLLPKFVLVHSVVLCGLLKGSVLGTRVLYCANYSPLKTGYLSFRFRLQSKPNKMVMYFRISLCLYAMYPIHCNKYNHLHVPDMYCLHMNQVDYNKNVDKHPLAADTNTEERICV